MIKNIKDVKILVVGDIMLDHYIIGKVDRISPEAPVPVVDIEEEIFMLGGAGNVLTNLNELGCTVGFIGLCGEDNSADLINMLMKKNKIKHYQLIKDKNRKTTKKSRIVTEDGVQLLRFDKESKEKYPVNSSSILNLQEFNPDIIIVSDYNKGFVTKELMTILKNENKIIIADPKPENILLYDNIFMITPNLKEYNSCKKLPNVKYVLITKGKDGMTLVDLEKDKSDNILGKEVKVFNVSGAGDTVISIISLCIAMGITNYKICCQIANDAASIVVTKPGTSYITKEEFNKILDKYMDVI